MTHPLVIALNEALGLVFDGGAWWSETGWEALHQHEVGHALFVAYRTAYGLTQQPFREYWLEVES